MKKLFILLAVAFVCAACGEDKFTLSEDNLAGTYWEVAFTIESGFLDGEPYYFDSEDPPIGGTFGGPPISFSKEHKVLIYHRGANPYIEDFDYVYDKARRLIEFGGRTYQLHRLTSTRLEWSFEHNPSERQQTTYTYYYERFEPDAKWFEKISHYEDRTGEK